MRVTGKLFTVINGNQIDVHARVVEDQGLREIVIIVNVKKPKQCICSVKKGHWYELCKNPITHLLVAMWPDGDIEYNGVCTFHANQGVYLSDWQQIIKFSKEGI